jgi:hypothetical protein
MKMIKGDEHDPKALIREAYNIDGITLDECRSIFLDWALGLPLEKDTRTVIKLILEQYDSNAPNHPMTQTLQEGLKSAAAPRRRGGWRQRTRGQSDIN